MDYREGPPNPRAPAQHGWQGQPAKPRAALPPELDPRGRRGKRSARSGTGRRTDNGARSGAVLGIQLVAAALSFVILIGSGYAWASFNRFTGSLHTIDGTKAGPGIDGADQNILLLGDDSRQGASAQALAAIGTEQNGGDNTDTIMLMHLPADGSKASVISFPRDSLVTTASGGQGKINSVYATGEGSTGDIGAGARALEQTITNVTGLTVDHFVKVSMFGFYDISQAIHGIDVNLCAAQNASTENDDGLHPGGFSGINLKAGWNHIQGKQALAFVRQRHGLAGGDYDRIARQEYFLSAVFRKIASAGTLTDLSTMQNLLTAVSKSLVVDSGLAGKGLLTFASQLSKLAAGNLTFSAIPMVGPKSVDGQYVGEQIDRTAMPSFINHLLGRKSPYEAAKTVAPSTVSLTVLNGGQAGGSAQQNASALTALGFKASFGDGAASDKTAISYPAGMESQAKTLAGFVPGAVVSQSSQVTVLTLVLGANRIAVKGVASGSSAASGNSAPAPNPTASDHAHATSAPVVRTAAQAGCIN